MNSPILSNCLRYALRAVLTAVLSVYLAAAYADTVRIVTYNIEADTGGYTTTRPGFMTVMEGIGNEVINGNAQPLDVLALQETTSNTTTVAPIVTAMNTLYGTGTYAMSPYQATQNGSAGSGNGPNAMVYNATTLQLIASVGIGTPSTSGFPRQPVRYEFRPVGGSAVDDFYVYVSHYKAGTTSSDLNRRNIEAQALRTNAATLPTSVRILYTGDFNLGSSSEASYVTLTASGQGQGFDPLNRPGNWQLNSAFQDILTESAPNLRYRDDFHLVTQNIMNDPSGLQYVAGSYHTFGVNGTTPINGSVNSPSNTALPGLPNRAAVLSALTTSADHLPVVADYQIGTSGQAPAFTGQPANQTVCTGGSASFTVTATGSPAPTYQWRIGTTNLTDGSGISGTTTTTLTINPVDSGDAATNYNCVATNSNGSATSNNATLTVNVGPAFTTQPGNQTACTGGSATFTVAATGSPAPTYQWRVGAANLSNGSGISGATTATLTINPVDAGDAAANYNCVVTNACGSATSNNAALTVNVGPAFTTQPGNQAACTGGSASFTVAATGSPTPTYQWRVGTANLSDGAGISGTTTATLTINPVDAGDAAANYNCVVTNTCGSATSNNAALTVNIGPAFTTQAGNQAACAGGSASFTVAATGSPAPTYQWRVGTTNLSNGSGISGATTATLTIDPVDAGDAAANYNCVVTNACGSATSNNATLTVNVGPAFTAQPQDQTLCAGGSASFSVSATGSPAPTYQWRVGTANLSNGSGISGATTATLTIDPVDAGDAAADYNCVVTNACGSATSNNAALTIDVAPAIVTQPQGQPLTVGGIAVFSVVAPASPPPSYQWRKNATPLTDGAGVSGTATATLTISPVAATDAGNYDVVITNGCGTVTSALAPFWQLGDMNCDGAVNGQDIDGFVLALFDTAGYAAQYPTCNLLNGDFTGDGAVNGLDIDGFTGVLFGP